MMNSGLRLIVSFIAILALAWVAGINKDTGNFAVAILLVLVLLWTMNNASRIGTLATNLGA